MIVLVCGGRNYSDRVRLFKVLDEAHDATPFSLLVHGASGRRRADGTIVCGADLLAGEWAEKRSIDVSVHPVLWSDLSRPGAVIRRRDDGTEYDAAAGALRNQRMIDVESPELVLAFPGHLGTEDVVKRAIRAGIHVERVK